MDDKPPIADVKMFGEVLVHGGGHLFARKPVEPKVDVDEVVHVMHAQTDLPGIQVIDQPLCWREEHHVVHDLLFGFRRCVLVDGPDILFVIRHLRVTYHAQEVG